MEITLSQEIIGALGVAFVSLIVALLWFLVWIIRHITSVAKALREHAEVNAEATKLAKDAIRDLREDRHLQENERDEWRQERDELNARMTKQEIENETRLSNLTREYARLQVQLKNEREAREHGERENARKIETLQARINQLEQERAELLSQNHTLKHERDEWKHEAQNLASRMGELESKVEELEKRDTGPLDSAKAIIDQSPGENPEGVL